MYTNNSETKVSLVREILPTAGIVFAAMLYKLMLDVAYRQVIVPVYGYIGYTPEYSSMKTLFAFFMVAAITALLCISESNNRRPSNIIINLQWLIILIPLLTLYGQENRSTLFVISAIASFILLMVIARLGSSVSITKPGKIFRSIGYLTLIGIAVYVYGTLIRTVGLGGINFNFHNIYEQRAQLDQTSTGGIFGYLISWQGYVINVMLVALGLWRRSKVLVAVGIFAQILLFGLANYKAFLAAPVFAIALYYLPSKRQLLLLTIGVVTLLVMGIAAQEVLGINLITGVFVNRIFFVPAMLHFVWYDFFANHPFVMLSNSILSQFVNYPYDMPLMHVVSQYYWNRDFSPNVGYLGDAYAQFGIVGMMFFSIILGLFLRMVDSVGHNNPRICQAIIAIPALALLNSALFTSLLTHGFIIAILLMWLLFSNRTRSETMPTTIA
jgi:hypothetical protein